MEVISYAQVENNLAEIMDKTIKEHTPLMITCENGGAVVLISLEDYETMEETTYLLQSPQNALRLLNSVLELEGRGKNEGLWHEDSP